MRIDCQKIPWIEDPFSFYRAFKDATPSVLLESARTTPRTGRYSIVAKDPFLILRYEQGGLFLEDPCSGKKGTSGKNPFVFLKHLLEKYASPASPAGRPTREGPPLPPFATGAIGFVGYECKDLLELRAAGRVAKPRILPDMYFLFFDRCLVWDHEAKDLFLCVYQHARTKKFPLRAFQQDIERARQVQKKFAERKKTFIPQRPMRLECSFNEREFMQAVTGVQKYIRHGEIFQANLAQRFSFPIEKEPDQIYARLREINPSPFFGVLDAKDFQIVSGSPERLLKLEGRTLETRPIAGTRARGKNRREDRRLALDLLLSGKERAEHIMLVDLERNDLGRVAEYGSVTVDEWMALEDYSHVKHIVSNVRGVLREGLGPVDALRAFFPGGTITGVPKIRCMQIIEELEPVVRGPYTGSLGYFSFTGNMDFNILIRSLAIRDHRAFLHVGAGIVADSEPKKEYHETLYKAEAVLSAVFGEKQVRSFFRRCGLPVRQAGIAA